MVFVLLVAGVIFCHGCASRLLYYPTDRDYGRPSDAGLRYEEVTFPSRDGTRLSGWFVPAVGMPKGTVLHFHGNAQNMTAHFSFVSWLPREGFNVFVFDYRGYGKSEGRPGRKGVHEDSCAALAYLRSRSDIDTGRILVLGQSLGGANALAAIHSEGADGIRAVALDSAFYSYRLIVRDTIKHIPVLSLLRWPLSFVVISNAKSPSSTIGQLQPIPVLIFHGTDDPVVPFRHGRLLFERAEEPRTLVTIPSGGHTDAFIRQDPVFRKQLVDFFESVLDSPVMRPLAGTVKVYENDEKGSR